MSEHTDFSAPLHFSALLQRAVSEPGMIAEAYSRFWNYSQGNQLLAMFECVRRGIEPGPIGTFMHWKNVGRHVRKGEKAITLCMPITVKRKAAAADDDNTREAECFTRFVFRPNWFVLAQTDGAEYVSEPAPGWDEARALASLGVERVPFDLTNGNVQGFARGRTFAVSPVAQLPVKTAFHELAHICLGHTSEVDLSDDSDHTPRSLREVEAEAVALLCLESLGIDGAEFCRGYIQHWLADSIPERSAQRIFKAASSILEAGRAKPAD